MPDDRTYWQHPVGAPTERDAAMFAELLQPGTVLLLGCTHRLLPLCDAAIDLEPVFDDPKIRQMNWLENRTYHDNIIGDGVFNLDKDLCHGVIDMASRNCGRLIVRSFRRKLAGMRYACYFPSAGDFEVGPARTFELDDSWFFVWDFR